MGSGEVEEELDRITLNFSHRVITVTNAGMATFMNGTMSQKYKNYPVDIKVGNESTVVQNYNIQGSQTRYASLVVLFETDVSIVLKVKYTASSYGWSYSGKCAGASATCVALT